MNNTRHNQAGFTLLETIVAFAILVMVLGVALKVFSTGAQSQRLALEYTEATILSRSLLNQATYSSLLDSGELNNKYHWQLTESYSDIPEQEYLGSVSHFIPIKVTVKLTWQSAGRLRSIQQSTFRFENNEQ